MLYIIIIIIIIIIIDRKPRSMIHVTQNHTLKAAQFEKYKIYFRRNIHSANLWKISFIHSTFYDVISNIMWLLKQHKKFSLQLIQIVKHHPTIEKSSLENKISLLVLPLILIGRVHWKIRYHYWCSLWFWLDDDEDTTRKILFRDSFLATNKIVINCD